MNNLNYGYPSSSNSSFSSFSSQFSSTPSNNSTRFQRPRFAYAGPPSYPRPRSSASKPNPDPYLEPMQCTDYGSNIRSANSYQNTVGDSSRNYTLGYSDSMVNNYGDSTLPLDGSLTMNNSRDSFGSSQHNSSSNYYTGNESFYQSPQNSVSNYANDTSQYSLSSKGGHSSFGVQQQAPNKRPHSYFNSNIGGLATFATSPVGQISLDTQSGGLTRTYGKNTRGKSGTFGSNRGNFRGRFQKNKGFQGGDKQTSGMSSKWKCSTCSIDFTSQIPLEMHLRGARHAKKLKTQTAMSSIQGQISQVKEIEKPDGKKFYCELCNVIANSSLQLQMHLDGTKHKNKLNPPKEEPKDGAEEKKATENAKVLNGKSNGGVTRPAPAEFGEPQPSKMSKYSCDVCNIIVNSDTQLQQHLTSKKHQAKVEGKPIIKKKKIKDDETEQPAEEAECTSNTKPEVTNVVGVKTLSASFVQGGTLN